MTTQQQQPMEEFDVVVVGGGAAGLNGGVTLGRARRSVAVIDAGEPRNAHADGVHMFLTRDGLPPADLLALGRQEVESYGGRIIDAGASTAAAATGGFVVTLDNGSLIGARRLLVTTGPTDVLPDVPGLRELWGRDVHHCPYCHGWELHGQRVGVLGSGPMVVHRALMFRQWVDDLVVFLHTAPEPTAVEAEQLAARGIRVVIGPVVALERSGGRLVGVRMADGSVIERQAMVVGPRMVARSQVLSGLGLEPVEHPLGMGEYIPSDAGRTSVPGVWVAGNVTDLSAGVLAAAAAGLVAAIGIISELIADDTARAVARYRESLQTVG